MNEMLANHYFLTGNFSNALLEFEKIVVEDPTQKCFTRKLMICYLQTENYEKALNLFNEMIYENINYFIENDDLNESCPCKELIIKIESNKNYITNSESLIKLGVLWAYFDLPTSFEMFRKAFVINTTDQKLKQTLQIYRENLQPKTIIKQSNHKGSKLYEKN